MGPRSAFAGIFTRLGARVTALGVAPDSRNMTTAAARQDLGALTEAMRDGGHDLGFAFDGDGDRVLAVDRDGTLVDGDELLSLVAIHLRERGRLVGNGVAVTVMSNFGFHSAMAQAGIEVATTAVGDRYVLAALRERGWTLGGEQSGHIIELGFGPSGDGIAAALLALEALGGADLHERATMAKLPQRLVATCPFATVARWTTPPSSTRPWPASRRRSTGAAAFWCVRAAPSRSCG